MTAFVHPAATTSWEGPSADPSDEQFGDVVEETALTDAGAFDAVLVGEPFDRAVIGRRGAAQGPRVVRESLAGVKTHHFEAGPVSSVGDLGDVAVLAAGDGGQTDGVAAVQSAVADVTERVHATDALPVFLGGDNSLTFPNVRPLLEVGSVGVVNLDAHLDVREVRGEPTSGTPYRQLFEAGLDAYACLGARHFETSTAYADFVRDRGGAIVTAKAVGADPETAVRRATDAMGDVDRVYVSVDLDVLDATAAPGVSAPTPGGLTTRELFRIVRSLAADERVAGFEVVECAPPLDDGGRTVAATARTVAHFLAGLRGSV